MALTTTEIIEVVDGEIVSGEAIFDPETVRNAIAKSQAGSARPN